MRGDGAVTLSTRVSEALESPATPGSLTNATVAFIDRGTGATIATVPVAADGTASYLWTPAMGTAKSKTFTIGFLVSNYYNRNAIADNVTVTVRTIASMPCASAAVLPRPGSRSTCVSTKRTGDSLLHAVARTKKRAISA
jgi:hypothetical protein